jgi:hypothetical protein
MWSKVNKFGLKIDGGDLSSLQLNFSNFNRNLDRGVVHEMTKNGNFWSQARHGTYPT